MRSIKAILGNRETHTVSPFDSVRKAVQLMVVHEIGCVPVVEGDRVVGIFTERDVMTRVVGPGVPADATPVGSVMSTKLVVTNADESYEVCLNRMRQSRVRHLIVLDGKRMGGVVSIRDLMAVDLDEKVEEISMLNAYVHQVPGPVRPN